MPDFAAFLYYLLQSFQTGLSGKRWICRNVKLCNASDRSQGTGFSAAYTWYYVDIDAVVCTAWPGNGTVD